MRALAIAVAIAVFAAGATTARAQALPRIHITLLGMHVDTSHIVTGTPYHLTIHVHITERRDRLDELQLPTLTNATDLGDERHRVAAPGGGTDFYEIMTLSSSDPGTASFSPAYVDAIDPATNRALRFSSQPLTVPVSDAAATPEPIDRVTQSLMGTFHALFVAAGAIVVVALLLALVVLRRARRRPSASPAVPARPPRVAPPPDVRVVDALAEAIATFRARGDDAALDRLRSLLFVRAGASAGGTLADALIALGGRNPALGRAMAIADRVRFGPQAERAAATRDLDDALEALLRNPVRA
jgi:hypothetical protein